MKNSHNLTFSFEQLQAINHFRGPALVIAGPGSGKTSVIVNRILNLIQFYNVNPSKILVITFSKIAAQNMQSRFVSLCGNSVYPVSFGTFHSFFWHIVKNYYGYNNGNIISLSDKRKIVYRLLKNILPDCSFGKEYVDEIIRRISFYKNSDYQMDKLTDDDLDSISFKEVVDCYNDILKSQRRIDFEDMMLLCKNILLNNKLLLDNYRQKFEFILLDEFQDINNLQYEIIGLLAGKERNIFAVGDDDQSIYGFRGSKPQIMTNFKEAHPDICLIKLTCNYRSTKNIVKAAAVIINDNCKRFQKNIYTNNELGEKTTLISCKDEITQSNYIAKLIKDLSFRSSETKIAILFRTNNKASNLCDVLIQNRISYEIKEKMDNLYENDIFIDFLNYLSVANSEILDPVMLGKIINKPYRYIDSKYINNSKNPLDELMCIYKNKPHIIRGLKKLRFDLDFIKTMDMYSAFNYFRRVIGYEKYIEFRYSGSKENYEKNIDIMNQLSVNMKTHMDFESLKKYVEYKNLIINSSNKVKDCNVQIMTFHASKGLEFDVVIIPDINEGIIPNKKANEKDDVEEERRMFYVACTRAKKRLILLYLGDRHDKKHIPSRFINKILEENDYTKSFEVN